MSSKDFNVILRRLKLLGLEIIGGSVFFLVSVVYLWASNEGSSWQTLFLWMAIISVVLSLGGVQILFDMRRLSHHFEDISRN